MKHMMVTGHTATLATRQEQFQALLDAHRKIVFKVANTYCRHSEDRRDLVQEISAQLWKAFPGYDAQRSFSTWMYRIALNVAISFVRSHSLRERHSTSLDEQALDVVDENVSVPESDERVRALQTFIERLDVLDRALLLLYLDENSYRDIADVLGISETNVATKISRLKQRLRKDIADPETP